MDESFSVQSGDRSLCLDEEDRAYLEALNDKDVVATKSTPNPLGLFSVVAFILQQVIGTGIFRTPWTVMQATESSGITLCFWAFGGLAAIAGSILYIEFGLTTPRHSIDGERVPVVRNGGDMNYVNYLIKRPKFFVFSFYAVNYVIIASSAANALTFGDDIIGSPGSDRGAAKDAAARCLAIMAVTLPCFLHAFTRRGGILLNNVIVVVKIAILCVFPIMAICVLAGVAHTNHATANMGYKNSFARTHGNADSYTQGMLAVFYAYGGYNQANYMIVVSKEQQLTSTDVALAFLNNVIGPKHASAILAIFTTINSFGNVIGMTFTLARAKQEIAKEGVLPFAKFFGENRILFRKYREKHHSSQSEPTPLGALFLHWVCAVFLILVTWPMKPSSAYRILANLYVYLVDIIPTFIMAVGMLYLRFFTKWSLKSPLPTWLSVTAALIYAIAGGFPLVAVWIPPFQYSDLDVHDIIPGLPWKGKEFVVEREPVFRMQNAERVQWHEIVLHSWVIKAQPEKRRGYMLDDL
ncbi:uncharacterized protein J4E87_007789 [Alternaria ethzedia]|uniref:uncharacterized protein n=1 Tax=Alternaria ethzedia TaxID=181014 RepID=UPI0020C528F6|nr:uncharacterized protein J4E87_007789 [Alternaria ethzedia]KAI4619201.1 hypothetical protein J4E87_007789 [Alternaria ethzedia]